MRTIYIGIATVIAATVFSACGKPAETSDPGDQVRINGAIGGTGTRANINDYSGLGEFKIGDTWGMYAAVAGNNKLNNALYTVGSTSIYWSSLSMTAPVTFSAHYPRITGTIADPEACMFNAATAPNPDLLVAAPVTKSNGEDVNLVFSHVMHQLSVDLAKELGVPGNLLETQISLLGMKSSAKVNLLTGAVDASGASGSDPYPEKTGASGFYVAPQDLTPGADWVKLVLGGRTYIFKVPASLKPSGETQNLTRLEPGKRVIIKPKFMHNTTRAAIESPATVTYGDDGSVIITGDAYAY